MSAAGHDAEFYLGFVIVLRRRRFHGPHPPASAFDPVLSLTGVQFSAPVQGLIPGAVMLADQHHRRNLEEPAWIQKYVRKILATADALRITETPVRKRIPAGSCNGHAQYLTGIGHGKSVNKLAATRVPEHDDGPGGNAGQAANLVQDMLERKV